MNIIQLMDYWQRRHLLLINIQYGLMLEKDFDKAILIEPLLYECENELRELILMQ